MATKSNAIAAPAITFTDKGKAARAAAYADISKLSFAQATSRATCIANVRIALGTSPSESEVRACKDQWMVGYIAFRLPASKVPLVQSEEQRIARAADLLLRYSHPPAEGVKARQLPKGKIGYRTLTEQKIVRAAESACSPFFAELGLSNAQTLKTKGAKAAAKAKAPGAPTMAGTGKGKAATPAPVAPSHAQLVKPAAPVTSADYVNHMQTQLAALLAFDSKYASKRPTTHGAFAEQLAALKQVANKAANDFAERQAAAIKNASK